MRSLLSSVVQNWKMKLLAVAMAVLLWVVVSAEQVTSNWIPVPLEVLVTDPGFELASRNVPNEVEVRFAGPGRELWDLVIRRPPLRLVVREVSDTIGAFSLDPRMVQLPAQLSVTPQDVRPSMVRLSFTRLATRNVPIRVQAGNDLAEGLTLLDTLVVEPRTVRVSGPASRIRALDAIPTRPVSFTDVDSSFSRTVQLDTSGLRGLDISETVVRVSGEVDRMSERTIANVPVDVGPGVDIRPDEVSVQLRGPRRALEDILPAQFRVVISIDSIPVRIPPQGVNVPLRVERLPAVVRAETSPRTVRLLPPRLAGDTLPTPPEPQSSDTTDVPTGPRS